MLEIVYKDPTDLVPYVGNSRQHPEAQVRELAASIKEFGFTQPILLDGKNGVIAGEGRLLAALKLDMDSVPCIELSGMTDAQKRAYVIADNRLAHNSEWDVEIMTAELRRLAEEGFNLELTGIPAHELEDLMKPPKGDGDGEGSGSTGESVVAYNIIFDDEAQQDRWYYFMRQVRGWYPDCETFAEALTAYIDEHVDAE